jgi:hypothetical protein
MLLLNGCHCKPIYFASEFSTVNYVKYNNIEIKNIKLDLNTLYVISS